MNKDKKSQDYHAIKVNVTSLFVASHKISDTLELDWLPKSQPRKK